MKYIIVNALLAILFYFGSKQKNEKQILFKN